MRDAYSILIGIPDGKRPLGRPSRRWEKILEWILRNWGGKVWNGFVWLGIVTSGGIMWTQTNLWVLYKATKFLTSCVTINWVLKKDSAPWTSVISHLLNNIRGCIQKLPDWPPWSNNCKWYSSLPLGAAVSLFCESV